VPSSHPLTVVAVHGNGGGASRFALVPREPAPGVRFEAVNLPGFDGRPLGGCRTAADFAAALLDDLGRIPAPRVVLGHGIGGSIALTALQGPAPPAEGLLLHAPVGPDLDRRLFPLLMRPWPVRRAVRSVLGSRPARSVGGRLLYRGRAPRHAVEDLFAGYARCEAFEVMFDALDADWFDGLAPVDLPAALLWGGRDRVLRVGQLAGFTRLLPGARTEVVPTWGHFPMIEAPGDYGRAVARMVGELVPC
jgi:pimeloyl-ACP methyl ester carboxylesterase